ncbi:hypothetical protein, partial [Actinomyces slackii]
MGLLGGINSAPLALTAT